MADPDRKPLPPYLPFKTFLNALDSWRVVLPNRIDRGVLGSYAGTMQSWVLSTLRYFQLTDEEGYPTESLKLLASASESDRISFFGTLAKMHYPFLFTQGFDLARTTPTQLKEKFEATGAKGETVVKAISFFSGLAKAGNIPMSPFVTVRNRGPRKAKGSIKSIPVTKGPGVQSMVDEILAQRNAKPEKTQMDFLVEILDPATMDDAEQAAVWTLIRYLKKPRD